MNENEKSRKIVKTIIDLAHSLQICVVAEGIEEKEQVAGPAGNGMRPDSGICIFQTINSRGV